MLNWKARDHLKQINIKVIPNAGRNELKGEKLYLNAPAVEGKANKALIEFLADHFNVKKKQVRIIKGLKSRNKVILIE